MLARMLSGIMGVLLSCLAVAQGETLNVGDEFPDWSMVDHSGASVTSVGYTGRSYVLWFYPEAMAPDATAEGRGFRDHYRQFESAGVAVLGVSFDGPQTNGVFASNEGFPFPLLTDSSRELAMRVGAAATEDQPHPDQITYLIGADGRVVKVYDNVQPLRHAREVLLDAGVVAP